MVFDYYIDSQYQTEYFILNNFAFRTPRIVLKRGRCSLQPKPKKKKEPEKPQEPEEVRIKKELPDLSEMEIAAILGLTKLYGNSSIQCETSEADSSKR